MVAKRTSKKRAPFRAKPSRAKFAHSKRVRRTLRSKPRKKNLTVPIVGIGGSAGGFDHIMERKKAEGKLASLTAYPHENSNPIFELDLETNDISYANPAAFEAFPDLKKRGFQHPFLLRVLAAAKPLLEGKTQPVHAELEINNSFYAASIVCVPQTRRLRIYSLNIVERMKQEARLAEQARLLNLTHDAIIVRDAEDRVTYWNQGAQALYGYLPEQALGRVIHKLLQTEPHELIKRIRSKLERNNQWSGEIVHRRKDGSKVVVMSRWALDRDARGRPSSVLESNTDITERKLAGLALKKSRELLENLVQQRTKALRVANAELKKEIERRKGLEGEILAISDREQQRLGQELHDGLCQHLTAVAFMARSVALRLKNHRVIDAADIEKIAQLVNAAATDTRDLSRALHRVDVDSAGLVTALQDLVDREIWNTPCRLEVKPSFRIYDDVAAAHLYRIAREAVINANKHAQAREIVIKLERSREGMVLRVTDDGVGVPKEPVLKPGLGVHIMNYRAQLTGGHLEIDSPKRGGTRVSCYLPDHAPQPLKSKKKESAEARRLPSKLTKTLATLI